MQSRAASFGIFVAFLLTLVGLVCSTVLLQHHLVIAVGGNPLLANICEATETASCDEVLNSEWGTFAGLPTSLWGVFFFAPLAAWFLIVGQPTGKRRWLHVLPVLATALGAVGCGYLAYVMYGTLDNWCPLCAATHVATWLLFPVALLLWPRRHHTTSPVIPHLHNLPEKTRVAIFVIDYPPLRLVLATLLLAAAIIGGIWAEYERRLQSFHAQAYKQRWQEYESMLAHGATQRSSTAPATAPHEPPDEDPRQALWETQEALLKGVYDEFMAEEVHDVTRTVQPGDPLRGHPDAPHLLTVYSDFMCPWCNKLAHLIDRKLEEYPGQFRVIFRHFPMDQQCNPKIKRTLHKGACAAAVVAEAALRVGGDKAFWAFHDAFFKDYKAFLKDSKEWAREQAAACGLDAEAYWQAATASFDTWKRIHANVAEGQEIGITGTPAVYLDGRRFTRYGDTYFWPYFLWQQDNTPAIQPAAPATTAPASETQPPAVTP